MTRDELARYLDNPKLLSADTLDSVQRLHASYPWCAPFTFLYLYNLACVDDIRYPSELRRLSILLPHREVLYRLVEEGKHIPSPKSEEDEELNSFDLIDSFLSEQEAAGAELPQELHFASRAEGQEYFSTTAELPASQGAEDELQALLKEVQTQPAPQEPKSEAPAEEELLSETLSKIYIQQGHYAKALRIIRTMSLNYPKKNRFFVDQIRFLERLIENNNNDNIKT